MVIAPKSLEQTLKDNAWNKFYDKLMQRDKEALSLVIDTIDGFIDSVEGNGDYFKRFFQLSSEKYNRPYEINKSEIQEHLCDYILLDCFKDGESTTRNMKECLEKVRDGITYESLSKEDKMLTLTFLNMLKYPPE